jgi:hypothetical protein
MHLSKRWKQTPLNVQRKNGQMGRGGPEFARMPQALFQLLPPERSTDVRQTLNGQRRCARASSTRRDASLMFCEDFE